VTFEEIALAALTAAIAGGVGWLLSTRSARTKERLKWPLAAVGLALIVLGYAIVIRSLS
jgi:hypothetical protein